MKKKQTSLASNDRRHFGDVTPAVKLF